MNYLFVFGAGRTGTTLVLRMIDKNSTVQIFPQETHAFPWLWKGNTLNIPSHISTPKEFATYILEKYPLVNFGWKGSQYFPVLQQLVSDIEQQSTLPKNAADFMQFVIERNIDSSIQYIGEKTPAHGYYYQPILNHFKNSKVIFTIRDPRATAYSELVKRNIEHLNLDDFNIYNYIIKYNTIYQQIDKVKQKIGSENVMVVRYEDVVLQPEQEIKKICQFLKINFEKEMLEVGVFNSSFGDKFQTDKQFNTENLDRWKGNLSDDIVFLIEKYCSNLMSTYNYKTTHTKGSYDFSLIQQIKMKVAYLANSINSAWFHHFNRNKKYK
ncbi:MAG: sulfotransferase [Chitinophagales bacterium]|nr:sulfotransferase [Chitinophagales bacterium]